MAIHFESRCIDIAPPLVDELMAAIASGEGEALRLSIIVVGDERMAEIHGVSHGDPTPTDVISFDLRGDGPGEECPEDIDGELIVNAELALREAESRGHEAEAELLFYVAHGALHLLGYDDQDDDSRARMHSLQRRYVLEIGVEVQS